MIDGLSPEFFTVVSIVSGLVGAALYVRARVSDHQDLIAKQEERFVKHEAVDVEFHSLIVDRLARIETKIDTISDRGRR